jgi:pyrroloquinoline quinone (PQQ) biosynthesis protein C
VTRLAAGTRAPAGELLARVRAEIERCAVGRDNPTHRRLVAGELTPAELRHWAAQQWHWHRAFPGVLATLAAGCPAGELRARLLRRAALEDGALPAESPGRCAAWERVSRALGAGPDELAGSEPAPETETMIAVQRLVAARPFIEAWVGIMAGVDGETQLHNAARREALRERYGVPDGALAYVQVPDGDPVARALEPIAPHVDGPHEAACAALRLVLHARWGYFDGIGRRARRAPER